MLDAAGAEIYHDGNDYFEVSTSEDFKVKYTLSDEDSDRTITYSAKVVDKSGETQSNAVTPSTGSLTSGVEKTLTVTAPKAAGNYKLVVDFELKKSDEDIKTDSASYEFKAVNPIKLTVNLKAEEVTLNLEEFGVYFFVDGQKMEDSYTTVSLAKDGTGSVSYNWIADPARGSTHTFYVEAVGETDLIKGLGEEHTFYANDNDYSLIIALAFVILIILIVMAIWIYRKPIKNYGKPKSRR
jgi:hypothetical protein